MAKKNKLKLTNRSMLIGLIIICIFAICICFVFINSSDNNGSKITGNNASVTSDSNDAGTLTKNQQGTSTGSVKENENSKNDGAPSKLLIEPTGVFVSAHKQVPVTSNLSSVCNTSAGAQCQILFINSNGQVKSLDARNADDQGSAYWNSWTPSDIGLSTGSWQVQARATLDDQSKTSTDAINLEIK